MKKRIRLPFDTVVAIMILALTAFLAGDGLIRQSLPFEAVRFPIFVFAVIFIVGGMEIVRSLRAAKGQDETAGQAAVFTNRKNFLLICSMIVIYGILLHFLGFIIATVMLVIAFVSNFKYRYAVAYVIITAVVVVAIYYSFTRLMHIKLPAGLIMKLFGY